ncbi:hypothetical protein CALCODRAFT_230666 [Calocera cornea HHB12733]|uniref:Uncharacterized protein n=1 Tax=Calocera cornea HHB12733 TaxID=1353952 RepID=A0A165GZ81_9BASI|nr:hypothetical protein CALCODRAFT_230666 [Calocera cornea HHB12733]
MRCWHAPHVTGLAFSVLSAHYRAGPDASYRQSGSMALAPWNSTLSDRIRVLSDTPPCSPLRIYAVLLLQAGRSRDAYRERVSAEGTPGRLSHSGAATRPRPWHKVVPTALHEQPNHARISQMASYQTMAIHVNVIGDFFRQLLAHVQQTDGSPRR